MEPFIDVVPYSDSFSRIWAELAGSVGAAVRCREPGEAGAGTHGRSAGLILAVAGAEDESLGAVAEWCADGAHRVAVVGAEVSHRRVVSFMKAGADEVFLLPADLGSLRAWMQDGVDAAHVEEHAQSAGERSRKDFDFSPVVGESPELLTAVSRAMRVIIMGEATVLVTGETGTGKEVLARAIHSNSPRAGAPFVEINCVALPPNLLEAELFGYERGAFTDARVAKPGLFEAADGGTLFLDEIGDLLPELQGKLLRVLESKSVRRLGSVRETAVNVRIIAATNRDLGEMVGKRTFRDDLFYRLSVVPIHLPPLRDRGEDVLLLAEHLLKRLSEVYRLPKPPLTIEVKRLLVGHDWPGNIRELKNSLERALVLGEGGDISPEHLFLKRNGEPAPRRGVLPFPASAAEVERALAKELLRYCNGNKSEAARTMGVSRRHFYVLLRQGEADEK